MRPYDQSGTWVYDVTKYGADNTGSEDAIPGMQAAYDECVADGKGGVVFAPPGIYLKGTELVLVMGAPNVSFMGAGPGLTTLMLAEGIDSAAMTEGPNFIHVAGYLSPTGYADNVKISGFTIDGRRAAQSYTSIFTSPINAFNVRKGVIHDVEVKGWHSPVAPGQESVCIHLVDSPMSDIRGCVTLDCPEVQGARLSGQVIGSSSGGSIVNHKSEGCMSGAVMWQVIGGAILGCESRFATYYGFDVEDCRGSYVGAGTRSSYSALAGVRFAESHNCTGEGILSFNNKGSGILVNGTYGPGLGGGSFGTLLAHNQCFDDQPVPTQTFGIEEAEASDYSDIHSNRLIRNVVAPKQIVGANTIYAASNREA